MKYLATLFLCLAALGTYAQESGTPEEKPNSLTISGGADAYYASYNTSLFNGVQQYATTSAVSEQFRLNIAQIGASYMGRGLRANVVLQYGDIARFLYPENLEHVQQANLGIKLSNSLWLDAGIFTSTIGAESFLPMENWFTTTSVVGFQQPFYQAGARLSYEPKENLNVQLWAMNGYNRLNDNNGAKSVGLVVQYKPASNVTLNYANMIGEERPDLVPNPGPNPSQFLLYNNLWVEVEGSQFDFVASADLATTSNSNLEEPGNNGIMYNAMVMARYRINPQYAVSARIETYQDNDALFSNVILGPDNTPTGLQVTGFTLGTTVTPTPNAYIRAEARYLTAPNEQETFFDFEDGPQPDRFELVLSMGFTLNKVFSW